MTLLTRPIRLALPALAAAGFFAPASAASAAWDNVFQVCCHDCRPKPATSYYAAPACDSCAPRQSAKVEYQQRSYYEPITVMKPEKYLEPVEVRSRSYYWEPVTSYSYSSYYDPCSKQCQQIATPRQSYKLKEQCNTSMRYVERIRMVPTQSQRMVTETVPVTTYYGPPVRTYSAPAPACDTPGTAPRVDELRPAPTISPERSDTIPSPNVPVTPNSFQRSLPPQVRPGATGFARTTARPAATGELRGEVVLNDRETPRAGAKLVLVNAADLGKRQYVTADAFGNFDVKLAAGDWHLYIGDGTGAAQYFKKLTVADDIREFKVVSR